MDLLKKNFYTEQRKAYVENQIFVEEDINIGSEYADIGEIIAKKALVKVTDQKVEAGKLYLKGSMFTEILYQEDNSGEIDTFKKEIPFDEEIFVEDLISKDEVSLFWHLEDLTPQLINPRKINIKALILIKVMVEELIDAKVSVGLDGKEEHMETRLSKFEAAMLTSHKKDILRIKQEIPLSSAKNNVEKILWEDISIRGLDWKPLEGKISIHGEASLFVLYKAQTATGEIECFETVIPVSGNVDVSGCQEKNVIDLSISYLEEHMDIKEDFDGENRILLLDLSIHLSIRSYEENQIEILSDLYGTTKDVICETKKILFKKIIFTGQNKKKIVESFPIEKRRNIEDIQISGATADMMIEHTEINQEDLEIAGYLWVKLYLYDSSNQGYFIQEEQIPVKLDVLLSGMDSSDLSSQNQMTSHLFVDVEQILANIDESGQMEIRALLNIHSMILKDCEENVLSSFHMEALDSKKMMDMPGMVVYFAKEGESLWQIGKKYYMSVSQIREQNHLNGDTLHQGDKLLLLKTL